MEPSSYVCRILLVRLNVDCKKIGCGGRSLLICVGCGLFLFAFLDNAVAVGVEEFG